MVIASIEMVKFKMFWYSKNMGHIFLKVFHFTSWTQDVNGAYRRRWDVFWTCYVRSIYIFRPGGIFNMFTCAVKIYKYDYHPTCRLLLMKDFLRQCGYMTQYFYVLGRKRMIWRTFVWYWCLRKVSFLHYLLPKLFKFQPILSKNTRKRTKKL